MALETELKLRIAPHALATLTRHPALRTLRHGRTRTTRLVSTYFDTTDGALAAAGVALRLRRSGRAWIQSIKGPALDCSGTMSTRPEFEWPVKGARLDPLRFAATPFRRTLGRAERAGLAPRFTTDVTRTTVPLVFGDGTRAHLCIDRGHIRSADDVPPRAVEIHEIEIELDSGAPQRLFELALALAADAPLALEPRSKAARGYALRHPAPTTPVRAEEIELPRKSKAHAALATILRNCLAQVEGNVDGAATSDDPEWIHQLRIGVRRLRACLTFARRAVTPARIEPLRAEWRWVAQALGDARDLDVFVLTTLPAFRAAAARGSAEGGLTAALAALGATADARRDEARNAARAALATPRFLRAFLAAGALAAALDAGGARRHDDARLARAARDYARPLLRKRDAALRALGVDVAHAAPEARHAARLAAKKLRYAAEFFAPLYRRRRARAYRSALAVLQDELGLWNDAAVAANLAATLAGAQSAAAAAFAGWAAAQGVGRSDALGRAWSEFTDARPFWTHDR